MCAVVPVLAEHVAEQVVVHALQVGDIVAANDVVTAIVSVPDQYIDAQLSFQSRGDHRIQHAQGRDTVPRLV